MNEFVNSFLLRNTYRMNAMLYYVHQLPFFRKWNLYKNKGLKTFVQFLAFGYELATVFIWKLLYLAILLLIPMLFTETLEVNEPLFFHLLFFLTFCGAMINTSLLDASTDKYYAIVIMKMDAKRLALSEFIYFQLRQWIGLVISMYFICRVFDFSWLAMLYVPLFIVGMKIVSSALLMKLELTYKDSVVGICRVVVCAIALVILVISTVLRFYIEETVFLISMGMVVVFAGFSLFYIFNFLQYPKLYRKLLAEENMMFDNNALLKEETESIRKDIADVKLTSNKKGFAYLNDLFIKRHKKILTNAVKWITIALCVALCMVGIVILWSVEARRLLNRNLVSILPFFLFAMYLINRGESITKAMFVNCDQSLLHYGFYRKPKAILEMFTLRLCSLVTINLFPAVVLAIGLVVLYIMSGPANSVWEYVVIFVTIICLSVFYSIHYLVLYYLLQPYNEQMEMKNPYYQVATGLTYFIAYVFMEQIDSIYFGVAVIGITVLYCIIALLLAYKLAPKTFKLK